MSLRDFNNTLSDDPIALHTTPLGNGAGLDSFHTTNPEDREPNNTPKIVGALAVALIVGVAGIGLYAATGSASHPKPMVASNILPSAPPAPIAQAAPDPAAMTQAPQASASVASEPAPMAPVKTASAKPVRSTARDTSKMSPQPQQQAAVIPEPVSPAPSPADVAANNAQPVTAVPQPATTASDVPAPAQDLQTGAAPAAAQSAGQVNQ
jgi:outer membrane biosynthesis protein TonB